MHNRYPIHLLPLVILSLLPCVAARGQTPSLLTRDVATGLDTPWEIVWGPDNWIWMTERPGRVSRVNPETGEVKLVYTVPDVYESGESGLLGMALHPGFADTAQVFLVYTYRVGNQIREKLVRYRYDGATLTDSLVLIEDLKGNTTHDGSRLVITPDRRLLITTGDAQDQPAAQNHMSLNGKILRINLDGTIPADNPYASAPSPANLIWSTGHRNPQGLVLAPNGYLYSSEHGPNNDDEVNIIVSGGNYGWPNVHGFCDLPGESKFCTDSSVVQPILAWTPTLAVAGIDYYNSNAIPEWRNSLLMVTLKEADLRHLKLNAAGTRISSELVYFDRQFGRLRDLCVAPDGRVFIATSNKDGRAPQGFPKPEDDRIIEVKGDIILPAIDSVIVDGAELDPGEPIEIRFTTKGLFSPGNVFTAQLSGTDGTFAQPRPLGVLAGTAGGTIVGKLPCEIPAGNEYRIRVVGSSPARNGIDNGFDITINMRRPATITPSGPTSFCEGDSVVLTGSSGYIEYRWSNGNSTRSITVRTPGTYSLALTDSNDCGLVAGVVTVRVFPKPAPVIVVSGSGAIDTLDAGGIYDSYQWLHEGEPIADATSRYLSGSLQGHYAVRVTDQNGCSGISDAIEINLDGVAWERGDAGGMRIHRHPENNRIMIELPLEHASSVRIAVIDMRGVSVLSLVDDGAAGAYRRELSLDDLPSGAYMLTVEADGRRWMEKMVR